MGPEMAILVVVILVVLGCVGLGYAMLRAVIKSGVEAGIRGSKSTERR